MESEKLQKQKASWLDEAFSAKIMTEEEKENKKAYNKAYREANKEKIAAKKRLNYLSNKSEILIKSKLYQEKNKEKIKERKSKHHQENKARLNDISKKYYEENKEESLQKAKEYYQNNKDKCLVKTKKYYRENREKTLENKRIYYHKKINSDPVFKLKKNIRNLISASINKKGYSKNSKTQKILDCTFEEFKIHLESKFENWMSWDNYGLYNGELNYGWDIDHIIPLCSVNSEEETIRINHFKNLQPLCSKINRDIKKGKI